MKLIKADNLACPLDGEGFGAFAKNLSCANGHSFDVARQGYVNLLPVQFKKSKSPGDSAEMVAARTAFLDGGYYQAIAERLARCVLSILPDHERLCLLDAGCGEGYYVNYLADACEADARSAEISLLGLDISKAAVLAAARRDKRPTWLVATSRHLPVTDAGVDGVICMFGYPDYQQFKRVLKPGGFIILVEAAERHLIELRQLVYDEVRLKQPRLAGQAAECGFVLCDEFALNYQTPVIEGEQLQNLALMTPHLFRAGREGKVRLAQAESITLTVDVLFRRLVVK